MRSLFLFFFSIFLFFNCGELYAAYPGDSYFTISGGLKTSYSFNLNLPFVVPEKVRKDESNAPEETIPNSVKTAAENFVNEYMDTSVTKNVSFGINGNFGYAFNRYFKGEIEASYYGGKLTSSSGWYPYLRSIQKTSSGTSTDNSAVDDKFTNFDVMANIACDIENASHIVPYVGAGLGAAIDNFWGSSVLVFQYHFFGGVDFALTPYLYANMSFDYMKSKDGDVVMRLKKKKTFTNTGVSSSPSVPVAPVATFPQATIDSLNDLALEFEQLQSAYNADKASSDVKTQALLAQAKNDYDAAVATANSNNPDRQELLRLMTKSNNDYSAQINTISGIADIAAMDVDSVDYDLLALAEMVEASNPTAPTQSSSPTTSSASSSSDEYVVFDTSSSVNSLVSSNDNRFRITVGLKFII